MLAVKLETSVRIDRLCLPIMRIIETSVWVFALHAVLIHEKSRLSSSRRKAQSSNACDQVLAAFPCHEPHFNGCCCLALCIALPLGKEMALFGAYNHTETKKHARYTGTHEHCHTPGRLCNFQVHSES